MRRQPYLVLGVLLGACLFLLGSGEPARSQRLVEETLALRLARAAKLPEADAKRFLDVLGPVLRAELNQGREVALPGMGKFRVVRVAEHKDLRDGRPVTIPATNTVEFLAEGKLEAAANSPTAQPSETVPEFKYTILPGQTPGQKTSRTRVPQTRTK